MLYQLFSRILNMTVTACPVIITVLFVRSLMYAMPKKYRYILWGIVAIRLICPYAISSPASLFNVIGADLNNMVIMEADNGKTDGSAYYGLSGSSKKNIPGIPGDNKIPSGASGSLQDNVNINMQTADKYSGNIDISGSNTGDSVINKKQIVHFIKYGAFIWLTGILFILSWNFYMLSGMKKHLERAVRLKENIYECENIPSPFVLGICHPKIYIPFQLGEKEQEYILKHEKYHIMRRDYIIKPAAFLLACVYWFNPLVWLSYFLMLRDMEMSCDEYVLQNMDASIRKDYSMSLLGFATNQRRKNMGLLSFGETDTRKRVDNVLNFKKYKKWIGVIALAVILAAGAACLTNAYDKDKETKNKSENKTSQDENNKKESEEENKKENGKYEALAANAKIHGYDVQVVYTSDKKLPDKGELEYGMYSGTFMVRTYKDNVKYSEYPLEFGINNKIYYPEEGFSLAVKDYNGDGEDDDFTLGQGQTPMPELGNFMCYQVFNVDKSGNITRYTLSTEDGKNLITIPGVYSQDFKCKNGEITYQALTESGVKTQTASISREIPAASVENGINPDGEGNSFYFENTGVTIGMPENKNWIQNPLAYENGNTGFIKYYDGIAKTDVTLGFGKENQKKILGFSGNSPYEKEYWSFFPGEYEQLIEVQFYKIKDNKTTVVLSWGYNKINFYMCADFAELENNNIEWTSLAKTAAYIAENWYNVLYATDNFIFQDKDIKTAKQAVKSYFKKVFKDCTIKKLWFDKDAYQRNVTYFSNLYKKDDIIILYSDFYVSKDCKDNSLEKDVTYTNFAWIMGRNKNGSWKVETYGY